MEYPPPCFPAHKSLFSEPITKEYRSFATLADREAMMKGGEIPWLVTLRGFDPSIIS